MCGAAHGPDGGAPRRAGHPLGPHAAMGGVRADPVALLDRLLTGPDRQNPYHDPQDYRAVLRQPGGHTRGPAWQGASRVGDLYPALWECAQSQCALSPALPRRLSTKASTRLVDLSLP